MERAQQIGICPRCGVDLARGMTPTGKVCWRCPSCGGVAVTLPALRESLDAKSIAMLIHAARTTDYAGCTCPGCGGRMSLLRVGDGVDKLEIDVCGSCLSVWCDRGEYETLAPPPKPKPGAETMRMLLGRTSPETREQYATAMLESLPEDVSVEDFDLRDVVCDMVRLVIGAPMLWRTIKPVSPFFAIVLAFALPVAQLCIYCCCNDPRNNGGVSYIHRRDFWVLSKEMAEKCGLDISAPFTALTFPFVQVSGIWASAFAVALFVPFVIVERRVGHLKFVGMFLALMAASVVTHALSAFVGLTTGRLCGIAPVALGVLAFTSFAWPDLHIRGIRFTNIYVALVGLSLFVFSLLWAMACDFLSAGFWPMVVCIAIGAALGHHAMKSRKLRGRP